jgi:hypothetical protein
MDVPHIILLSVFCFVLGVVMGVSAGSMIAPHDCELLGKFSKNDVVYACALEKK